MSYSPFGISRFERWRQRHHGDAVERERRLLAAASDLERGGMSMTTTVEKLFQPHELLAASIDKMKEAALAASKAEGEGGNQ